MSHWTNIYGTFTVGLAKGANIETERTRLQHVLGKPSSESDNSDIFDAQRNGDHATVKRLIEERQSQGIPRGSEGSLQYTIHTVAEPSNGGDQTPNHFIVEIVGNLRDFEPKDNSEVTVWLENLLEQFPLTNIELHVNGGLPHCYHFSCDYDEVLERYTLIVAPFTAFKEHNPAALLEARITAALTAEYSTDRRTVITKLLETIPEIPEDKVLPHYQKLRRVSERCTAPEEQGLATQLDQVLKNLATSLLKQRGGAKDQKRNL